MILQDYEYLLPFWWYKLPFTFDDPDIKAILQMCKEILWKEINGVVVRQGIVRLPTVG